MLKIKKIIKNILRYLFELSAVTYLYMILLNITNAKDETTILGTILMIIYAIVTLNLFEWCFDLQ